MLKVISKRFLERDPFINDSLLSGKFLTCAFPIALLLTVAWAGMSGVMGGYPPLVHPTVGDVWPRPQMVQGNSTYMIVRPETFK